MCWSSFFPRKRISILFEEAVGGWGHDRVGPVRSQHKNALYNRRLRYWQCILWASASLRLSKDSRSCCRTSQKTPLGFIPGNCQRGDRWSSTSQREGSFGLFGFARPRPPILERTGLLRPAGREQDREYRSSNALGATARAGRIQAIQSGIATVILRAGWTSAHQWSRSVTKSVTLYNAR